MSFSTFQHSRPRQFSLVLASFLQQPGLPFSDVLTEEAIQKAFDDAGASFLSPEKEECPFPVIRGQLGPPLNAAIVLTKDCA